MRSSPAPESTGDHIDGRERSALTALAAAFETQAPKEGRGAGEARSCGTEKLGDVITATIQASGVSCGQAHGVVHAVEYTRSYVPVSPYFTYSQPYSVSTPAGRFTCRREPFGLAGSEHNIRCKRANVSVSWSTAHD